MNLHLIKKTMQTGWLSIIAAKKLKGFMLLNDMREVNMVGQLCYVSFQDNVPSGSNMIDEFFVNINREIEEPEYKEKLTNSNIGNFCASIIFAHSICENTLMRIINALSSRDPELYYRNNILDKKK